MSKATRKVFFKWISSKRKAKENVGPLLNGAGDLATQGMEEAEVLNTFFTSVFTSKTSLRESKDLETRRKVWSKKTCPWWK